MPTMNEATRTTDLPVPQQSEAPAAHDGDEMVMGMLQEHVPLSLLIDLTDAAGPESTEILAEEGVPETRWWES
jgi:hypothetical protein